MRIFSSLINFWNGIICYLLVFSLQTVKQNIDRILTLSCREQHPHSMISAMSSIMTRLLEEKLEEKDIEPLVFQEKFSEPLWDVIFQNLLKEAMVSVNKILLCVSHLSTLKLCIFFFPGLN